MKLPGKLLALLAASLPIGGLAEAPTSSVAPRLITVSISPEARVKAAAVEEAGYELVS